MDITKEKKAMSSVWTGTIATNLIITLCGIGTGILSARMLAPDGRGILAAIMLAPQLIASLGSISFHEAITVRQSRLNSERKKIVATGIFVAVLLTAIVLPAGYLLISYISQVSNTFGSDLASKNLALLYFTLFLPINFISLAILASLHGEHNYRSFNLLRSAGPVLYLALLIILWLSGSVDVESVLMANLVSNWAIAIVAAYAVRNEIIISISKHELKEVAQLALKFHPAAVVVILASQFDKILAVSYTDSVEVGLYMVAFMVASSIFNLVVTSVGVVGLSAGGNCKDDEEKKKHMGAYIRISSLAIAAMLLLLVPLSIVLIPFLFGEEYRPSIVIAVALSAALAPKAMRDIANRVLRGLGMGRLSFYAEMFSLSLLTTIGWYLTSRYGMNGLMLGMFIANVVPFVFLVISLRRVMGLRLENWWGVSSETIKESVLMLRSTNKLKV